MNDWLKTGLQHTLIECFCLLQYHPWFEQAFGYYVALQINSV